MTNWEEASGRAAQPDTEYPEELSDDADDAIDETTGDLDHETEEAARRSGYAGTGGNEEVADDA